MKSHARVVVIGGGVVGVSTLYHLAKKGWSDVALIERKELTSGSTWHAAGLLPLFNMSYSVGQVHKYSVAFYQELQEETGMNVGFRKVSNIRLATHIPQLLSVPYFDSTDFQRTTVVLLLKKVTITKSLLDHFLLLSLKFQKVID